MSAIRVAVVLLLLATRAMAQSAGSADSASPRRGQCTYRVCALGIAPVWNGLDVINGASGSRVASLGFFWPTDITRRFIANDSASIYAARAVHVRRAAATLTDAGLLLAGYAVLRRMSGSASGADRWVGAIGAGAFVVGVPLQFSADGLLSRAVWWENSRYAP